MFVIIAYVILFHKISCTMISFSSCTCNVVGGVLDNVSYSVFLHHLLCIVITNVANLMILRNAVLKMKYQCSLIVYLDCVSFS